MTDSLYWILTISFVLLTAYYSILSKSILRISWNRLEDAFEARGYPSRLEYFRKNTPVILASCNLLRLLSLLSFVLCIVWRQFQLVTENYALVTALLHTFAICAIILSIFFVVIPHIIATYWGNTILVISFGLIRVVSVIFRPIIWVLYWGEPLMRRLAGVEDEGSPNRIEERQEELLSVVEEQEKEGVVDEEERDMIESVLEFRATTSGEIMTPRTAIVGIDISRCFDDVVSTVLDTGHSRYPVYEDNIDNIVGMLYAKDMLNYLKNDSRPEGINEILREAFFVPETKNLRDLLHDFKEKKVHVAVVLDEYGGTAGLVSFEDILEELVGEIEDEHEQPRADLIKKLDDLTYEIDARAEIYELIYEYELKLPEDEDYETLGGFVFSQLGHIPIIGESFEYGNMKFTVLDAEKRKINLLRLDLLTENNIQES